MDNTINLKLEVFLNQYEKNQQILNTNALIEVGKSSEYLIVRIALSILFYLPYISERVTERWEKKANKAIKDKNWSQIDINHLLTALAKTINLKVIELLVASPQQRVSSIGNQENQIQAKVNFIATLNDQDHWIKRLANEKGSKEIKELLNAINDENLTKEDARWTKAEASIKALMNMEEIAFAHNYDKEMLISAAYTFFNKNDPAQFSKEAFEKQLQDDDDKQKARAAQMSIHISKKSSIKNKNDAQQLMKELINSLLDNHENLRSLKSEEIFNKYIHPAIKCKQNIGQKISNQIMVNALQDSIVKNGHKNACEESLLKKSCLLEYAKSQVESSIVGQAFKEKLENSNELFANITSKIKGKKTTNELLSFIDKYTAAINQVVMPELLLEPIKSTDLSLPKAVENLENSFSYTSEPAEEHSLGALLFKLDSDFARTIQNKIGPLLEAIKSEKDRKKIQDSLAPVIESFGKTVKEKGIIFSALPTAGLFSPVEGNFSYPLEKSLKSYSEAAKAIISDLPTKKHILPTKKHIPVHIQVKKDSTISLNSTTQNLDPLSFLIDGAETKIKKSIIEETLLLYNRIIGEIKPSTKKGFTKIMTRNMIMPGAKIFKLLLKNKKFKTMIESRLEEVISNQFDNIINEKTEYINDMQELFESKGKDAYKKNVDSATLKKKIYSGIKDSLIESGSAKIIVQIALTIFAENKFEGTVQAGLKLFSNFDPKDTKNVEKMLGLICQVCDQLQGTEIPEAVRKFTENLLV